MFSLADPGFGQEGPQKFFPIFCPCSKVDLGERSEPILARSRVHLRALKALTFLTVKYAFSNFPGNFSSNYYMSLCVGKLQNIYFHMKDYFVSWGSGTHLGPQKLSNF